MFKKVAACLFSIILIISFGSEVKAADSFDVLTGKPTTSDFSGYIEIFGVRNSDGFRKVTVFSWFCVAPYSTVTDNVTNCRVNFTLTESGGVSFQVYGASYVSMWYMNSGGQSSPSSINVYAAVNSAVSLDNFSGYTIKAYNVYGNCSSVSTNFSAYNGGFSVNYTDDSKAQQQLNSIYQELIEANTNDAVMLNRITSIMANTDDVENKLESLISICEQYFPEILDKLDITNSWLEKIFNYLTERPEEEKQEAETTGSSSVSSGEAAIEDKSAGFTDSVGTLASSMSYSGTNCSWTFPTVKLPAISGVMDEVTLISEQEIDFSFWVNQIPAPVLLVVRSALTIALIVYCFKEIYGTISYLLTLNRGGES